MKVKDKIGVGHTKHHLADGKEITVAEASRLTGLKLNTLYNRMYRGMSLEEAMKMPYQVNQVRVREPSEL